MRQRVMIAMALACTPEDHHCRRAHDRARRDDPGADPRPAAAAEGQDQFVHHAHHPRPRRHCGAWRTTSLSCTPAALSRRARRRTSSAHPVPPVYHRPDGVQAGGRQKGRQALFNIPGKVPNPVDMPDYCYFQRSLRDAAGLLQRRISAARSASARPISRDLLSLLCGQQKWNVVSEMAEN